MKKFISALFVLLLFVSMVPLIASAAQLHDTNAVLADHDTIGSVSTGVDGVQKYVADAAAKKNGNSVISDDGEVEDDGINMNVATVWIIIVSVVMIGAIMSAVVVLAKRNKGKS